jgi:hypothetical protein
MELKPLPKELQIYQAAKQFSVAAGVIEQYTRIPDSMMFAVQPFVTCAVFSVELYLKCILAIEGQPDRRGHKVAVLFDALSQPSKDGLLFYIRGAYKNLGLPMAFLERGLAEMDNAFVEWRYLHERHSASMNLEFLRRIAWACQMHIKNLRPEWWPNPS